MGQVDISNLIKEFDDSGERIIAVSDIDITIQDGEFLVLVGPSGCGKSTTLRCIGGLERVTEGKILIDSEDITDKKPKNRNIAMVFQNYALYPHMTAQENMAFGLKMTTDLEEEEINERVHDAAEMMDIVEILDKTPQEISGGQQQRVALGRAIVRDPDVFLMDEPLSNLDAKLRTSMRTELQNLQQELGVTTIYVTHDQTEAMTMGDRIAILNDGKLQQVGTPLECYHQPENKFVAGFIGSPSMNFVNLATMEQSGTTVLEGDSFEYPLSDGTMSRMNALPDEVTLGIRPEDIRLANEESGDHTCMASVTVTEPLGDRTLVYLELDNISCTASLPGDLVLSPEDQIEIEIPEDRIHLFDPQSGEALLDRDHLVTEERTADSIQFSG